MKHFSAIEIFTPRKWLLMLNYNLLGTNSDALCYVMFWCQLISNENPKLFVRSKVMFDCVREVQPLSVKQK